MGVMRNLEYRGLFAEGEFQCGEADSVPLSYLYPGFNVNLQEGIQEGTRILVEPDKHCNYSPPTKLKLNT